MKNQNRKRKYDNGVPVIRAKKEMGRHHAVVKSISVGKLGKHLSAPAWAILYHACAWSTWDRCEYRSGIRSIATALALDPRQVKRGMSELVALGIFTPQERSPIASKREATVYIVSVPKRFDDGRLQLITGEVAPAKHAGRTARNVKNPNSPTLLKVKSKTKSVAVLVSETKAAKAALLKQKQEQNIERVRVEQAKREQERIERERIEQAQRAQYKQERIERERIEQERIERERIEQERIEREKPENKLGQALDNERTLESFHIIYMAIKGEHPTEGQYERWLEDDSWRNSFTDEVLEKSKRGAA